MGIEEKRFLLKLVDGQTEIFDKSFSSDIDIQAAEKERTDIIDALKELLPEQGRWDLLDQLEGAILLEREEVGRLAYTLGMRMGAKLVSILEQ